jgi:spore photoproduct lyase
MISTIYFEEQVADHPRTLHLFEKFPLADRIPCTHYKEVFNPGGQNFRIQKKKPALILAGNSGKKVHPVPATYGIGGRRKFLFFAHAKLPLRLPVLLPARHVPIRPLSAVCQL